MGDREQRLEDGSEWKANITGKGNHNPSSDFMYNQVTKLRAELDSILQELQSIMHAKLGLELEIAAYRKLLESEEHRYPNFYCLDSIELLLSNIYFT